MNRVATGVIVVLLIVAAVLAWTTDHYHGNAVKYKEQRDTATHKLALANATITDMMKRQRDVAALDARYTKELADANATIESLRADVSAGRKRLQVSATCPKSTTGTSGMGDGESPRLTADAELNYYRLRSGIDKITAQVNYLQEYIRSQCLK
ncbi:lysis protein [Salmonella enterica]|uniref:Lysis protein n=1 Tax=Salmonella enterica TaxID=28901 RepID=A0A744GD95_SALER|nr:lysis protein [Salmonella enterica]EBV1271558.1 lysis protein [Salmonella enterica subsp. enterica serovar Oranienburg]EBD5388786.1 lysis protein [Salmonella enterica]EBE4535345.1 lysis protein [Salmonella enterica]EBH6098936.1 lysis protein [Salmonella enterica]